MTAEEAEYSRDRFLAALWQGEREAITREAAGLGASCGDRPPQRELLPFLYYYGREALPEALQAEGKRLWLALAGKDLRRGETVRRIREALAGENIAVYLLKGTLLAERYYPESLLRDSVDVDILVPEERALAAFERIRQLGWSPQHEYCENPGKHLPELHRDGFPTIEVHTVLFSGRPGENRAVCAELERAGAAGREAPELLLCHLVYHAFAHHFLSNGLTLMVDIGMVLRRGGVDPEHYRQLAERFDCAGLLESLLHSFPELYPAQWRTAFPVRALSAASRRAIRGMCLKEAFFAESNCFRRSVLESGDLPFWRFALRRLRNFSPAKLGEIYRVPRRRLAPLYPLLALRYLGRLLCGGGAVLLHRPEEAASAYRRTLAEITGLCDRARRITDKTGPSHLAK